MTTRAFAPGSVTFVFVPTADGGGSRGASVATADGVRTTVTNAAETTISLDGTLTEFEPVERLFDALGVTAEVALDAEIPVGCGFGASGAATLSSALAANAEFGLDRERDSLVEAAHRAEVAAGTGLGDVFVQEGGGLAYDLGTGRERVACDGTIAYTSVGGIDTADVLGDEATMERVRAEGNAAFSDLAPRPTLEAIIGRSWPFAKRVGLPTDRVVETVEEVEAAGGVASMAMVGETVLGVGVGAEDTLSETTTVAREGARVL